MSNTDRIAASTNPKTVSLEVNGRWQAVKDGHGTGERAEFLAHRCHFVVVTAGGTLMHGAWMTRREAELFAHSTGRLPSDTGEVLSATVLEVVGYWYVAGFGEVHP